jgi:hypothetical protein
LGELKIESFYGIWGFMLFDYHQLPSTKTKPSQNKGINPSEGIFVGTYF